MIYDIRNLCFYYPGNSHEVLNNVSFSLAEGEIFTILGPNGAGKSTLLRCMLNLLQPRQGTICLSGQNIAAMKPREIARQVSYVQQTQHPTFSYTVEDFVLMGRAPMLGLFARPGKSDRAQAARAMEEMGIFHLHNQRYTEISGGERQQAMIARAIVREPRAILFDEPTAHLDFGNQLRTLRMIKKLSRAGYAMVVTTHNPDHAILLGGHTAILYKDGRLRWGSTEEMVTEQNLRNVYDAELRLQYLPEFQRAVCIYPNL